MSLITITNISIEVKNLVGMICTIAMLKSQISLNLEVEMSSAWRQMLNLRKKKLRLSIKAKL